MSLDIRHPRGDILDVLVAEVRTEAERLAKDEASGRGCALAWAHDSLSPQIVFHPDCIDAVRAAAVATVGEGGVRKMFSGAGHDRSASHDAYICSRIPNQPRFVHFQLCDVNGLPDRDDLCALEGWYFP